MAVDDKGCVTKYEKGADGTWYPATEDGWARALGLHTKPELLQQMREAAKPYRDMMAKAAQPDGVLRVGKGGAVTWDEGMGPIPVSWTERPSLIAPPLRESYRELLTVGVDPATPDHEYTALHWNDRVDVTHAEQTPETTALLGRVQEQIAKNAKRFENEYAEAIFSSGFAKITEDGIKAVSLKDMLTPMPQPILADPPPAVFGVRADMIVVDDPLWQGTECEHALGTPTQVDLLPVARMWWGIYPCPVDLYDHDDTKPAPQAPAAPQKTYTDAQKESGKSLGNALGKRNTGGLQDSKWDGR